MGQARMRFEVVLHYAVPLTREQVKDILGVDPLVDVDDYDGSPDALLAWHLLYETIPALWEVKQKDGKPSEIFLMGPHLTIAEDKQWTSPLTFLESDLLNMTEWRRKQSWKQWLNEELGSRLEELGPSIKDAASVLIAQDRIFRIADTHNWGWYTTIERYG
jgi:hypothetical protein